ncbi:SCO2521 family protein [Micromonospora sp. NBC_01796]|uniref:SCO2521 family protein n=1 Tax=Micromonospora sp. NBC_01796 TaxID=2975987 RepID=UPI002DD94913|nr:SCO2521 family protein [Micromonospora sp. NBC_01796]WSA88223.1 SCO2521 family protein [Micromonospora sp. NBC_01796]
MLTVGEVHTGLLQNSTALPLDRTAGLLDLLVGERVRRSERPIAYAVSPDQLSGVDCRLPTASGSRSRGVGTVVSHAAVTGGHVLQGSTHTRIDRAAANRRLVWSHYLSRPGQVETIGKVDVRDITRGFLGSAYQAAALNLGAVSARTMDTVQASATLDHRPPFRAQRTCLRWAVVPVEDPEAELQGTFRVESDTLRTLELTAARQDMQAIVELCEDLALHDWLLTTLVSLMESSLTGPGTRAQKLDRLRPAIDCLLHLWMPAARLDESVLSVWQSLERRPGFSRQWQSSVTRIRDQVSLGTIAMLETPYR